MNHLGVNMQDCKAALASALPYAGLLTPDAALAYAASYAPAGQGDLQRFLLQCMLEKQTANADCGAGVSPALFGHLYNAYFNALLKQFAEYYSSLLHLQPEPQTPRPDARQPGPVPQAATPVPAARPQPQRVLSPCSSQDPLADPLDSDPSVKKAQRSSTSFNDFQDGITVGYTYDAFFVTDGRSRKRKQPCNTAATAPPTTNDTPSSNDDHLASTSQKRQLRYVCNECGKNYATSSNLSRHKQTHRSLNSKAAKKCPHCDKVYVSMPALSMHILTHDLKHKCDVCGKAFSRLWLLNGHKRIHSKEKPYGCAHCGKAFADRSNLRAHIQTHSQFKLYKCDFCGKSFALKSYLNKHYESSACCAAALNGAASHSTCAQQLADLSETATVCASDALSPTPVTQLPVAACAQDAISQTND